MTTRLSNTAYLTVLDPLPLENIGWTVRVLSERDYATQIALISRFDSMGFTTEVNATGGGQVVLDADDPIFYAALPVGEVTPIVGQQALWQFYEDGVYRSSIFAEDVDEDVVPEGGGLRTTTIQGRGLGSVLEWAKVLPAGMPSPTSMTRAFTAHPMSVWVTLFNEAQAAGFLPFVSLLFDVTVDSSARAWGATQKVEVQAGDNLLDLLTRWCEAAELTWTMLPGFRLQVIPVSFGRRLEDKVVFTLFRGQVKHGRQRTRRDLATVVYAASGDKGVAISADGDAEAKWHKRMAWVSAGDSADATGRSAVANASLALLKGEQMSRSIVVPDKEDGRRVFIDYLLNDWIMVEVPEDDSESGARQVRAISVGVDVDGAVDLELTLQSRFQSRMEKLGRSLEAMGGSSSSGAATSKISVTQAITATQLEDLANVDTAGKLTGDVLMWNGVKWVDGSVGGPQPIDWLSDVDTVAVAPTNGQTLVFDSVSGLWKPGTIAGGGGGPATPIVTDTFTRSDSATAIGTATSGQVWQTSGGTYGISGSKAYTVSATGVAWVNGAVRALTAEMSITFGAGSTTESVIIRLVDANNYLHVIVSGTSLYLYKYQGGVFAQLKIVTVPAFVAGTVYRVRAEVTAQGQFTAYLNGVSTLGIMLTAAEQAVFLAAGAVGVGMRSASAASRYDDLIVMGV